MSLLKKIGLIGAGAVFLANITLADIINWKVDDKGNKFVTCEFDENTVVWKETYKEILSIENTPENEKKIRDKILEMQKYNEIKINAKNDDIIHDGTGFVDGQDGLRDHYPKNTEVDYPVDYWSTNFCKFMKDKLKSDLEDKVEDKEDKKSNSKGKGFYEATVYSTKYLAGLTYNWIPKGNKPANFFVGGGIALRNELLSEKDFEKEIFTSQNPDGSDKVYDDINEKEIANCGFLGKIGLKYKNLRLSLNGILGQKNNETSTIRRTAQYDLQGDILNTGNGDTITESKKKAYFNWFPSLSLDFNKFNLGVDFDIENENLMFHGSYKW
jgi:hypothetical protein